MDNNTEKLYLAAFNDVSTKCARGFALAERDYELLRRKHNLLCVSVAGIAYCCYKLAKGYVALQKEIIALKGDKGM